MRVGVYIDGFNLYYGGRSIFGRGTQGWKWLDLRNLSQRLLGRNQNWLAHGSYVSQVVYCTSRLNNKADPQGWNYQDAYLKALRRSKSIDLLVLGRFTNRIRKSPLATLRSNKRITHSDKRWPLEVRDGDLKRMQNAKIMASYQTWEEKGSDVNLATHLLKDVLCNHVDAAIVITNDSDLSLPLRECRLFVPVGTVNPGARPRAGDLQGDTCEGVGDHWWYQITKEDFLECQLPAQIGKIYCPEKW